MNPNNSVFYCSIGYRQNLQGQMEEKDGRVCVCEEISWELRMEWQNILTLESHDVSKPFSLFWRNMSGKKTERWLLKIVKMPNRQPIFTIVLALAIIPSIYIQAQRG